MILSLFACMPMTVLPPPVPMAKGKSEVGVGLSYTFGESIDRQIDLENTDDNWFDNAFTPGGGLQGEGYYRYAFSKNFQAGATVFYGQSGGGPGGGVFVRVPFKLSDKLTVGLDGQIGLLWYAVGLPIAYEVADKLWIGTEPMYRAGTVVLPLTATYKIGKGWMIGAEALYYNTAGNEELGTEALSQFGMALSITKRTGKDEDDDSGKKKSSSSDSDSSSGGKKGGKKKGSGGGDSGTNR